MKERSIYPAERNLPCWRLSALSYLPYRAARGPDDIPLHRVAIPRRVAQAIFRVAQTIFRCCSTPPRRRCSALFRAAQTCRRCSAPPRRRPEVIPHLPDVIPRRPDAVSRRAAATCPTTPLLAASSGHHCSALTPVFARLPTLLCCVRSPILTRPACTPVCSLSAATTLRCPAAAGPLSYCHVISTLLRGTATDSSYTPVQLPTHLRRFSCRYICAVGSTPLHMADTTAASSSSDVAQPPQLTELPRQSGKHSIVSALAKPAYTFDGSNYGPWRCAFLEFLNAHGLRHHLTDSSPKESDPTYSEWSRLESAVCSWLISSVATQIMEPLSMTRPARALWLKLETMYANKSNVSRTVRLYEELFACRQGTRTLHTYYGAVDAIFTNLELYQPLVLDLDTLRRYCDELRAGAFLSGLRPELADMIRGQVLGGSRVLPTEEIFVAALRVQDSFPASQSSQPTETSALIASGGAPRASRKNASSGRTRNSYPSCKYCGKTTHPSEKCWKEFGKPAWAMAAAGGKTSATMSPADGSSSTTPSAAGTVSLTLSPSELAYIQASRASSLCPPTAPSASLATLTSSLVSYAGGRGSSPGTPSISTPHTTSWIIDSGASSLMTGLSTSSPLIDLKHPFLTSVLLTDVPVLSLAPASLVLLRPYLYRMSFIFLDSLRICCPSVRSLKPFTAVCFSILITASSRI